MEHWSILIGLAGVLTALVAQFITLKVTKEDRDFRKKESEKDRYFNARKDIYPKVVVELDKRPITIENCREVITAAIMIAGVSLREDLRELHKLLEDADSLFKSIEHDSSAIQSNEIAVLELVPKIESKMRCELGVRSRIEAIREAMTEDQKYV